MRGRDFRVFCMTAQKYGVYLLVRRTNESSLPYVGKPGYYPKPLVVKAKTADLDPPPMSFKVGGQKQTVQHRVAGLVVHPDLQPQAFAGNKVEKAVGCWRESMDVFLPPGADIPLAVPESRRTLTWWGREHLSTGTGWRWRVDIDPQSVHFGCLQVARDTVPWSYLHGDYDLKDVIVKGQETHNEPVRGLTHGVKNVTPLLPGLEFETIRRELNDGMGVDMVQHGAEAQFAGHGDEPINVILPEGPGLKFLMLENAEAVQSWYMALNRALVASNGKDYLGDKSRWFWFGNHGSLFLPGFR